MGVTLDYRSRPSQRPRAFLLWARRSFLPAMALYTLAGVAALAPGLHNEHPYLPLWWIAFGPATALLVWRFVHRRRREKPATILVAGLLLWIFSGVAGVVGIYGERYGIDPHAYGRCRSNLRQLGQVLRMYASEYDGRYPPTANELLGYLGGDTNGQPVGSLLICPSDGRAAAAGATTRAAASSQSAGVHMSYSYVAGGVNPDSPPDTILMYEDVDNHSPHEFTNVLYADGHVETVWGKEARSLVARLRRDGRVTSVQEKR